ncbi:hypothetical protein [Lysinibacillus odysseyi]|uniref:DUF8042 domain-containing protein n=1 Tax=Lysinibacillus odysseyi 34hs-1 = NBRC 100172 TaxID=1220589 RepID=A0A0A3ILY4_9BACI|nr:hypothetical protein [Lysinibacillus odysseyi]KGR83798.1 hypothetical protein CD32_13930 [Lysinibacillus odysseyi 34hs-1 = NBRC 100172]
MDKLEIVNEYYKYISKIPTGLQYISDNLRTDNVPLALDEILNFSEGLSWITKVEHILIEQGVNTHLNKQQLDNFLNLINEGLEKQDFVLVADIFEYEILPYFEQFLAQD